MPFSLTAPWALILLLGIVPIVWFWREARNPLRPVREVISLILRLLVWLALVLALAGLRLETAVDRLAVVFLVDVSHSVGEEARLQAEQWVREALQGMGPDDQAGVILFGREAMVDRPLSPSRELEPFLASPDPSATDVAAALRLGLAMLPANARGRLVLLSDGQTDISAAEEVIDWLSASGVTLDVLPLAQPIDQEAWVAAATLPSRLFVGETADLQVEVESSVAQTATLQVVLDGTAIASSTVDLNPGTNRFTLGVRVEEEGFHTVTVYLFPSRDSFLQNNRLSAFTVVRGNPAVLIVAADEEEARPLQEALHAVGFQTVLWAPTQLGRALSTLSQWAAIILVDVPARELPIPSQLALQTYVRDVGGGVICVGGESSYGMGGYYRSALEELLPVEMTLHDRSRIPPIAIIFIVDKSGSMGDAAVGASKIAMAREAVVRSVDMLMPGDRVGVIAFDDAASWVWPFQELTDPGEVQTYVATLRAGGGTNILAGLQLAAPEIKRAENQTKHLVLLTDGQASHEGIATLVDDLREAGVTISTIAIGQDADRTFLKTLANWGGGRYYFTNSASDLPLIFTEETAMVQRNYIVEERFFPAQRGISPILAGIDEVPPLYGYVATSAKPAAQVILESSKEDPILAQWQYGLGRSVAWTSDAKGRWAREWVQWDDFARFWGQVVRWTMVEQSEALEAQFIEEKDRVRLSVDAVDPDGTPLSGLRLWGRAVAPDGTGGEVKLDEVAPGRYEGTWIPRSEGTYIVHIQAEKAEEQGLYEPFASLTTGYVHTYSPEYRSLGLQESVLRRWAEKGGGRWLAGREPQIVFSHDAPPVRAGTPLWPLLLRLAIFLWPVDIGVRRLALRKADLQRAWAAWSGRLRKLWRREKPTPEARRELGRLLRVKDRVRSRVPSIDRGKGVEIPVFPLSPSEAEGEEVSEERTAASPVPPPTETPETETPEEKPSPEHRSEETLGRLLEIKRRRRPR